MAFSKDPHLAMGSLTNDEIKHRISDVFAYFVSDVEPASLSDWLIQEKVISTDQWQRIRHENSTLRSQCRALLNHLFCIHHPRAFLVVRQALVEEGHYLLDFIDSQEPGCGIREQPGSHDDKVSELKEKLERERKVWAEEKEHLMSQMQELQNELSGREKLQVTEQRLEYERKEKEESIKQLEDHRSLLDKTVKILKLEQKLEQQRKTWIEEKEEIMKQILEQHNRAELRYKLDPVLVQTIRTKAAEDGKKLISGLTILDIELFVVSRNSSEVEVYDSMKFSFSRRLNLKDLIDPVDIGSCNRIKCLYIYNYKGLWKSKEILRVDPNGKLIKIWTTGKYYGHGLSVTDESNAILAVHNKNKLSEYSSDGQLIREINLSSGAGILHPHHSIKLTYGNFLVSHGWSGDDLHRVCVVDGDGKRKNSFGGKPGSNMGQMNCPRYLAVDGNGFVMVVDQENVRVLLLDIDLEFKKEIVSTEKHGLRCLRRILLDQTNGRLFVADNELDDQRILVFDFR